MISPFKFLRGKMTFPFEKEPLNFRELKAFLWETDTGLLNNDPGPFGDVTLPLSANKVCIFILALLPKTRRVIATPVVVRISICPLRILLKIYSLYHYQTTPVDRIWIAPDVFLKDIHDYGRF